MALESEFPFKSVAPLQKRSEPRLWVKELAVFRQFKVEALMRHVSLHPGLNIVWAQDSESGASGHAAGKSTFARLLRYLIGDVTYGSEVFRESFRKKFPDGCVAGEVRLDGRPWLIMRHLGRTGYHWCVPDAEWPDLFTETVQHRDYHEFTNALTESFVKPLASVSFPGTQRKVEWIHILQWLTRDQDARYSHLLEWRPSTSESAELRQLTANEKTNLVRMVLGLLTGPEMLQQRGHSELLTEQNAIEGDIPKLVFARDHALKITSERFPELNPKAAELLIPLEGRKKELDAVIAGLEKSFTEANRHDGVGEVLTTTLEIERAKRNELHSTLENDTKQLRWLRLKLSHQDGKLTNEELRAQSAELGDIKGKCSNSLEIAHLFKCPIAPQLDRDEIQAARLEMARSQTEPLAQLIKAHEAELAVIKKQLTQSQKTESDLDKKVTELKRLHSEKRQKVLDTLTNERAIQETIKRALSHQEEIITKRERLKKLRTLLTDSTRQLADLRKSASDMLTELSNGFSSVATILLNEEIRGKVTFHSEEIAPTLNYDGDMSSAALVTLRLLIFDLACLLGSVGPFKLHPGFLLHDSPREADLSAVIYRRIFTLIHEHQSTDCVQYIIATTEPPPEHLREEPWLICEPLSSAKPELRFLRTIV